MTQRGGDAFLTTIVESHYTTVAQRQLQFALTLLASHLARHRTVYLVGQPVFAGHVLHLKHLLQIFGNLALFVFYILIFAFNGFVHHNGLGRMAEHLSHIEVKRFFAVALHKREVCIARGLAHHIHRGALTLRNLCNMFDMLLVNEQAHALLALVGNYFLGREGLVADRKLGHVDLSATLFHKFGEAVDVAGRAVVVNRDNRVDIFLAKSADKVIVALLHLRIGALHGVEFDTIGIAACVYRRNRATAQSDAIVVATNHNDLVALLRFFLQAVALGAVAHATGKHNNLIVSIFLSILTMFKSQHRARDERLAKLVAEVAGTIGGLYKNLLRTLVQPFPYRQNGLPRPFAVESAVSGHVDGRAGYGPRTDATAHTVADFATRTGRGTVKRLNSCREVVGLGLERDNALDILDHEVVARALVCRSKLLHNRSLREGHIIFIGRQDMMRILLGSLLDHGKQRRGHLLAVNYKGSAEYLVAAMLRIDLSEAKHLRVGKFATKLSLHIVKVFYLFGRKSKAFFLVVFLDVFYNFYRCRLDIDVKNLCIKLLIHSLQHGVILRIFAVHGKILFYTLHTRYIHVLRNLHGIRTPRSHHFAARTDEETVNHITFNHLGIAKKPAQGICIFLRQGFLRLYGNHAACRSLKKLNHIEV